MTGFVAINGFWNVYAMLGSDVLYPHAPSIMNMRGDIANSSSRIAGKTHGPQLSRQVFDEINRHSMVCMPGVDQTFAVIRATGHFPLLKFANAAEIYSLLSIRVKSVNYGYELVHCPIVFLGRHHRKIAVIGVVDP